MQGMDYVDRGDHYEVVGKGPFINKIGRFGVVLREFRLKEGYILFSDVPPITVKYPKTPVDTTTLQGLKDLRTHLTSQVFQTIREAPKEIHAAYRKAYYKAIKEYDERVKNNPAGQVDDREEDIEMIRDEQLSFAQIKADQIIRDEQIRADQIRASYRKAFQKVVGALLIFINQPGEVNPHNVNTDLAATLSVKGTFEESDTEKQISDIEREISNRQALAELKAKQCIAAAHIRSDKIIKANKLLLASEKEMSKKFHRDPGEGRKRDEALLGFKDNLSP